MMSNNTLDTLKAFAQKHKKAIGCTEQEYQLILMILKKYYKMIKTKCVIDQDIELEKLETLINSLND